MMPRRRKSGGPSALSDPPWRAIAGWALGLNAAWEFAQCVLLYDMWDSGLARGAAWMGAAIAGDVGIVVVLVGCARRLRGSSGGATTRVRERLVLLGLSMVAAILLEWAALRLDLWTYGSRMPVLPILGERVGISPILQITSLPVASVMLASRSR